MKPRDKWRGFMSDRDDLERLIIETKSLDESATDDRIHVLNEKFYEIRTRHREQNVS